MSKPIILKVVFYDSNIVLNLNIAFGSHRDNGKPL